MLLRHTASALALAATLALTGAASPLSAGSTAAVSMAPSGAQALTETGNGPGPGLTCAGCVVAGVVTVATGGWFGVWATFMVGGTAAVAAGGAIVTCSAACVAYLNQD